MARPAPPARAPAPPRVSRATPCRCAVRAELPGPREQRAQARGRVTLAALGCVGAQQRRQRRDLDRHVGARERSDRVTLERRALGPPRRLRRDPLERLGAARRVPVGLGFGDGRLTEQVDRAGDPVVPQAAQHAGGRGRRLADDEPVRHVLDAGRRRGAERGASGAHVGDAHRRRDRRGSVGELLEEAAEVARHVVERPARRDHVDEPKQRRSELAVARRQVHRPGVERAHRVPGRRWDRTGQLGAHSADLVLELSQRSGEDVDRARDDQPDRHQRRAAPGRSSATWPSPSGASCPSG